MTAHTWLTPIGHTDDASFRAWIAELSGKLETYGLIKAGDTGQINTGTANRPSVGNAAGYEIRYLNDSLHGSAPIFLKIEYGTDESDADVPAIWITVGKGSNGSGTITTELIGRFKITNPSALTSTVANYSSFICQRTGYFALAFKMRANLSGAGGVAFFALCRWCDDSGTPLGTGFDLVHAFYLGQCHYYTVEYATPVVSGQITGAPTFFPGPTDASLVSGGPQLTRYFTRQPQVRVNPFLVGFLTNEFGDFATFTATPVGATSRTFLSLGGSGFTHMPYYCAWNGIASADATLRLAMQYD